MLEVGFSGAYHSPLSFRRAGEKALRWQKHFRSLTPHPVAAASDSDVLDVDFVQGA